MKRRFCLRVPLPRSIEPACTYQVHRKFCGKTYQVCANFRTVRIMLSNLKVAPAILALVQQDLRKLSNVLSCFGSYGISGFQSKVFIHSSKKFGWNVELVQTLTK